MENISFSIEQVRLELKYAWAISRNTSEYKINSIIKCTDGILNGYGEGAPNIRYEETPEKMEAQFAAFTTEWEKNRGLLKTVLGIDAFNEWLDALPLCNALRFGIESAYTHYLCKVEKRSIYTLLGIEAPVLPIATSYSLPIMDAGKIKDFFTENKLSRFGMLKVKVNADDTIDPIKVLSALTDAPLLIDGNECWTNTEELIRYMEKLKPFRVAYMEQPMPARLEDEYQYLKKHSLYPLIADESCTTHPDMEALSQQFHGINMKLMKAGGYLNGLRILNEAKAKKLFTMIGCMVETSIGIASAMNLCHGIRIADLDGFMLIKEEPFGLLKEKNGSLYFND